MKKLIGAVILAVFVLSLTGIAGVQNAQELYAQGLLKERAAGDLEDAIKLFERASKEAGSNRELAANALIAAARCYEKLGQTKAATLYERVVQDFPEQTAAVATAMANIPSPNSGQLENTLRENERVVAELNRRLLDLNAKADLATTLANELQSHPESRSAETAARLVQRMGTADFLRQEQDRAQRELQQSQLQLSRLRELERVSVRCEAITCPSPDFDQSKPIRISKGTIRNMEFQNPKVTFAVESEEDNGTVKLYRVEGCSPAALVQLGWKSDSLKDEDSVEVLAFRSRSPNSNLLGMATVTLPDGRRLFTGGNCLSQ
jgi:hypothetical protein